MQLKWIHLSLVLPVFALSALAITGDKSNEKSGFAVVELFTSEGCSSCPPADKLLGEIVEVARTKDQNVYALSFHVDYWNYIGWQDPYSDKRYSERQRRYAEALGTRRIYTPQMVVNGRDEFVGSNKSKAERSIAKALESPADVTVRVDAVRLADEKVIVDFRADFSGEVELAAALVERDLVQSVKSGENRGRTLHHENVVRAFSTKPLMSPNGSVTLEVPEDLKVENSSVILYLQQIENLAIIAASGEDLRQD